MSKDIGKKRKEREKKSRVKVLRRREAIRAEAKKERERERLDFLSKKFSQEPQDITMNNVINVNLDRLSHNLESLKAMEQEFVEMDNKRIEYQEKIANGEFTNPTGISSRDEEGGDN